MNIDFGTLGSGFAIALWCIIGTFVVLTIAVIVGSRIEHSRKMKNLKAFRDALLPELEVINTTLADINVTLEEEVRLHQNFNAKFDHDESAVEHQNTVDYLAKRTKHECIV